MGKQYRITAMDVHSDTCDVQSFVSSGRGLRRTHMKIVETRIKPLRDYIKSIPGKQVLVFEEGLMAAWLRRNLQHDVEKVVVSDPRRNALIYSDGIKSDKVDSEKLAQLYHSGMIREVYHTDNMNQQKLKDLVIHYDHTQKQVTRTKNQIKSVYRGLGIVVKGKSIYHPEKRKRWINCARCITPPVILETLYNSLDQMEKNKSKTRLKMAQHLKHFPQAKTFQAVPGVGIICAATFFAIVDTPWRFSNVHKLWHYCGVAVGAKKSNDKWLSRFGLLPSGNRMLRNILFIAVGGCLKTKREHPIKRYYKRHVQNGKTFAAARNATARKIAAILYGMWKNGSPYNENMI